MGETVGFSLYRGAQGTHTLSEGEGREERERGCAYIIQELTKAPGSGRGSIYASVPVMLIY